MTRPNHLQHQAISQELTGEPSAGISSERQLSSFEYDFAKTYVYALHSGRLVHGGIQIKRCVAHSSLSHRPSKPSLIDGGSASLPQIGDGVLEATVSWKAQHYEVTIAKEIQSEGHRIHTMYCLGLTPEALAAKDLIQNIVRESIAHSIYRNKVLRISWNPIVERSLIVKPIEILGHPLSKIILEEDIREAIEFMIQTIIAYPMLQKSLRYLLEGMPGVGKTETIRSVIDACSGFGTFLLVEGAVDVIKLFDFSAMFEPCIVCLDDLDLIFGNRNDLTSREDLGNLLTALDGVCKNNVFLLGTVNQKKNLDEAASRPCRWDAVLNIKAPTPAQYLKLVKERCRNEHVIGMFTDPVMDLIKVKDVTGAFIVNLVKHLEITDKLWPEKLNEQFVLTAVERLHRGFYKRRDGSEKSVGFGGH